MFCQSCGAQIPDGSTFCASCGSAQAPQQAAPQQAAPQQSYAPQQAAPKAAGGDFMHSLQFHDIMKKFGLFISGGLYLLLAILIWTGCQYGSRFGYNLADAIYGFNGFCRFMDIFYGLVLLVASVGQVFFWAQFNNNKLGFLPMIGTQKTLKFYNLANLILAAYSAFYFLVQGICVAAIPGGMLYGFSFFTPWVGIITMLIAVGYYVFTMIYYKNVSSKLQ